VELLPLLLLLLMLETTAIPDSCEREIAEN
jgi:hypothetical protein